MRRDAPASAEPSAFARLVDAERSFHDGWWIHALRRVDSTSSLAAKLPAWHAVRAETQEAGRGRTGRHWVSDRGGLWLSAVLPCAISEPIWQYLPLAIGWSLALTLRELGVRDLRLRWPNDLMVGRRKLGGILVERFDRESAVVGIGMNAFNTPQAVDPLLNGAVTRLRDLLPTVGSIEDVAGEVLASVRFAYETLLTRGFDSIADDLNARWLVPHQVELTIAGQHELVRGRLLGIDRHGALRLLNERGLESVFDATQVAFLRETD